MAMGLQRFMAPGHLARRAGAAAIAVAAAGGALLAYRLFRHVGRTRIDSGSGERAKTKLCRSESPQLQPQVDAAMRLKELPFVPLDDAPRDDSIEVSGSRCPSKASSLALDGGGGRAASERRIAVSVWAVGTDGGLLARCKGWLRPRGADAAALAAAILALLLLLLVLLLARLDVGVLGACCTTASCCGVAHALDWKLHAARPGTDVRAVRAAVKLPAASSAAACRAAAMWAVAAPSASGGSTRQRGYTRRGSCGYLFEAPAFPAEACDGCTSGSSASSTGAAAATMTFVLEPTGEAENASSGNAGKTGLEVQAFFLPPAPLPAAEAAAVAREGLQELLGLAELSGSSALRLSEGVVASTPGIVDGDA
eukprot:TRINITY_DN5461_c1_g1_i1.p1 TRINITY_DN5461_c1_g1~~TRINITY_DN5461_c1_g1_i1.p1  ORF type:complete len:423 (-),score=85.55 TRINITY_DN5461_c1_g1_i1:182-1285(-)